MEGDVIVTPEFFKFEHLDETPDAEIIGEYRSMGWGPARWSRPSGSGRLILSRGVPVGHLR